MRAFKGSFTMRGAKVSGATGPAPNAGKSLPTRSATSGRHGLMTDREFDARMGEAHRRADEMLARLKKP